MLKDGSLAPSWLRNYVIKRPVDRLMIKRMAGICLFLGIIFILLLVYLRQPLKKVELEKEIYSLNNYLREMEELNQRLRIEKQSLLELSQVKERAKQLVSGFKEPKKGQIIWIGNRESGFFRE